MLLFDQFLFEAPVVVQVLGTTVRPHGGLVKPVLVCWTRPLQLMLTARFKSQAVH